MLIAIILSSFFKKVSSSIVVIVKNKGDVGQVTRKGFKMFFKREQGLLWSGRQLFTLHILFSFLPSWFLLTFLLTSNSERTYIFLIAN